MFTKAFPATLAALHSVRPADVGLLQYGRAGGYAKRQVSSLFRIHLLQEAAPDAISAACINPCWKSC